MIEIKEILASARYVVRSKVLRNEKSIETSHFPEDELPTTRYFGLFNDELIGIISLLENKNPMFSEDFQLQIRGMPILEDNQGLRLGKKLLENCENNLKNRNKIPLIWFNARESAISFYQKLGYTTIGEAFKIKGFGENCVMYKKLCV